MRVLMASDVYFPRINGVSTSIDTFRRTLGNFGVELRLVVPSYQGEADTPDILRVAGRPVPRDPEDRLLHWRAMRQTCLQADVIVEPQPVALTERRDYFGNRACHFAIESPHRSLEVTARSLVDVREGDGGGSQLEFGNTCSQVLAMLARERDADTLLAREFVLPSPLAGTDAEVRDFAAPFFAGDRPFLSAVRALTQSIFQEFRYDTTFSDYHDY